MLSFQLSASQTSRNIWLSRRISLNCWFWFSISGPEILSDQQEAQCGCGCWSTLRIGKSQVTIAVPNSTTIFFWGHSITITDDLSSTLYLRLLASSPPVILSLSQPLPPHTLSLPKLAPPPPPQFSAPISQTVTSHPSFSLPPVPKDQQSSNPTNPPKAVLSGPLHCPSFRSYSRFTSHPAWIPWQLVIIIVLWYDQLPCPSLPSSQSTQQKSQTWLIITFCQAHTCAPTPLNEDEENIISLLIGLLLNSWTWTLSITIDVVQTLKDLPAMWESWVQSLDWKDPLEEEMATHSSILAWRIPWTVLSMVSQTWLST